MVLLRAASLGSPAQWEDGRNHGSPGFHSGKQGWGGHPFKQPGLPQLEQALKLEGEAAPQLSIQEPQRAWCLKPRVSSGQTRVARPEWPDPSWSPSLISWLTFRM